MWGKDADAFMIGYTQNAHITVHAVCSSTSSPPSGFRSPCVAPCSFSSFPSIRSPFVAPCSFSCSSSIRSPFVTPCSFSSSASIRSPFVTPCSFSSSASIHSPLLNPALSPVHRPSALLYCTLLFLQFTVHPLSLCCTRLFLQFTVHPLSFIALCSFSISPSIRSPLLHPALSPVHRPSALLYCTLLFLQFTVHPLSFIAPCSFSSSSSIRSHLLHPALSPVHRPSALLYCTLLFLQFTVHLLSLCCTLLFLQFTVHPISLCCTLLFLILSLVRRNEPILAIAYDGVSAHEVYWSCGRSDRRLNSPIVPASSFRLTELVPFNYCLYKIGILELVCVCWKHNKAPSYWFNVLQQ